MQENKMFKVVDKKIILSYMPLMDITKGITINIDGKIFETEVIMGRTEYILPENVDENTKMKVIIIRISEHCYYLDYFSNIE